MGITTDAIDVTKLTQTKDNGHDNGYDANVIDVQDFFENVIAEYNAGADGNLAADTQLARSIIPAGTGALRDFSYIAPEIPVFYQDNCVACMTCVVECPDTAILGKVVEQETLSAELSLIENPAEAKFMEAQFAETNKFFKVPQKKGKAPGMFGIFIDPTKCKGCAECVEACEDLGYNALKMIEKEDTTVPIYQKSINFFRKLPATPEHFINDRVVMDMMLSEQSMLYVGGAGSCAGCGEATVIRSVAGGPGLQIWPRKYGHCSLHRLQHRLWQHLPL